MSQGQSQKLNQAWHGGALEVFDLTLSRTPKRTISAWNWLLRRVWSHGSWPGSGVLWLWQSVASPRGAHDHHLSPGSENEISPTFGEGQTLASTRRNYTELPFFWNLQEGSKLWPLLSRGKAAKDQQDTLSSMACSSHKIVCTWPLFIKAALCFQVFWKVSCRFSVSGEL